MHFLITLKIGPYCVLRYLLRDTMKISSTRQIRNAYKDAIASGRLTRAGLQHAKDRGDTEEMIAAAVERVHKTKASLALQGSPLLYRAKPIDTQPFEPTEERKARAGSSLGKIAIKATSNAIAVVKGWRIKSPIEQHGEKFPEHLRLALERFMDTWDIDSRVCVSDLNRTRSSESSRRLGGLGRVPQTVRDAYTQHVRVRSDLEQDLKEVARALLVRERLKPDGTPYSLEEFGAKLFPTVIDKNRRWGIGCGALWALAIRLVELYRRHPLPRRDEAVLEEERLCA